MTDGLADAMFPVWDASGKYLWFLASTNFGLRSQWLDMTSYDREETFGLYFAVLKKGEPSPLLPESDEDAGISVSAPAAAGRGGRGGQPGAAPAQAEAGAQPAEQQPQAPPPPRAAHAVTVQIDFDGLQQRIMSVPGVPERQYSQLKAGAAGTVFYLEAAAAAAVAAAAPAAAARCTVIASATGARRRSSPGVAEYDVSADGRKLLYRTGGGGGGRGGRGGG